MLLHWLGDLTVKLANNLVYYENTKHVGVDRRLISEKVEGKDLMLAYKRTVDQIADFLWK